MMNGLSWEELANKVKIRHLDGSVELFFSPQHVQRAIQIVYTTAQQVHEAPGAPSVPTTSSDYRVE